MDLLWRALVSESELAIEGRRPDINDPYKTVTVAVLMMYDCVCGHDADDVDDVSRSAG